MTRSMGDEAMMAPSPPVLTGQCLCGAAAYTVPDAFEYAMYCHCARCRRTTGSAFKAMAGLPREHLNPPGPELVFIYGDEALHDVHCRRCGSLLYSIVRDGAYVHVAMGTLVDEPSIHPSMHIFVDSKAAWHQISDDLPRHAALP